MKINAKFTKVTDFESDCIILPVFNEDKQLGIYKEIDNNCRGILKSFCGPNANFQAKLATTQFLPNVPELKSKSLLLVGCGKAEELNADKFLKIIKTAINAANELNLATIGVSFLSLNIEQKNIAWKVRHATRTAIDTLYSFEEYKSKKKDNKSITDLTFIIDSASNINVIDQAITEGEAIAYGMEFTKNLANTPANICNPIYLAKAAENLAKEFKEINVQVLDEKKITAEKMNTLMSVAQGSINPPRFIILKYNGSEDKNARPVALVGKGITFDTGGNSLKPAASMIGMKYDMCGAATVLGVLKFAALAKLKVNLVGIIAAAENMPGASASRPDDIVTSLDGLTVEILNTDAEGRLVLADALTYSKKYNAKHTIDIATLTGACIVALGHHNSGLLSNDDDLADQLFNAGQRSRDKCWRLPISDDYQEQINSNFADVANIGEGGAGTITAGCFLARFTKDLSWAHLDVAGTACEFTGKGKKAKGRPLPLLAEFLLNYQN